MATYFECIPDNHIFIIIALYTAKLSGDDFNAMWKYLKSCWRKLNRVVLLGNRNDSHEIKKYLMVQLKDYVGINNLLAVAVSNHDSIGVNVATELGGRDDLQKGFYRWNVHVYGTFYRHEVYTLLQYAAHFGDLEIVRVLLITFCGPTDCLTQALEDATKSNHKLVHDAIHYRLNLTLLTN